MRSVMSENVKIVPALCTQCGGSVEVNPGAEKATCPFCGMSFIVEKAINNYNVQHATIEHADNVNIDMSGTVKTVLDFAGEQMKESRKLRNERRIEEIKANNMMRAVFLKMFGFMFASMMVFAVIAFIVMQFTGNDTEEVSDFGSVYTSDYGYSIRYDESLFAVNEGTNSASFVYQGESAGTNMVTVSYTPNKQPEEVLYEMTSGWGDNSSIIRDEGYFPGTDDKWGYWRTLNSSGEGSGLGETAIAGEYNGGVLSFEIISHLGEDDYVVSDALSAIIDSITYEDFGPQTMYEYIPGTYHIVEEDEQSSFSLDDDNTTAPYSDYNVVLNEDHTGTLTMEDTQDIYWGSYQLIPDDGGYAKEYTIEGDYLYIDHDGEWYTFEKVND